MVARYDGLMTPQLAPKVCACPCPLCPSVCPPAVSASSASVVDARCAQARGAAQI